ncbi:sensor histidine kinase [Pseudomonadota bacterium]
MISLQRQLRRNMLLTLLVAMAALLLLVNAGVERLAHKYVLSRLQHDAESLIAAMTRDSDGPWTLNTHRISTVYDRVRSGHYYLVHTGAQQFRSRSLWDRPLEIRPLAPGRTRDALATGPGEEQWLTWAQGVRKQNDDLTVWVAEDIHPLQVIRYTYSAWALVLIAATLLVLLLAQQWLLRRGFRQLDGVRDSIRALRGGENEALRRDMPAEVQPLVEEIDRLLTQLYQRVMRSRNALGNLAHELKRPMQRLTMLVEAIQTDKHDELHDALDDIRRLLDRELKRARIVGVSSPGRQTDVAQDLPRLIEVLHKLYPERTITTTYPPHLVLPQDRDDLLELFGNLLDNACKCARDKVQLTIIEEAEGWIITIVDDGPGVTDEQIAKLTERGMRFDESATGTGLGLAICKDICDSYDGELAFDNRPQGGLEVKVVLPRITQKEERESQPPFS